MTDTSPCSLDPDALAARMAAWAELDAALVSSQATPSGAELRYRLEPGVAGRLLALVEAEARCCPGLTLEATVTLAVHAPEEMRGWAQKVFVPH